MREEIRKYIEILYNKKKKLKKYFREYIPYWVQRLRYPKAVYLVMTPEHGNLGDQAIAYAEDRYLKKIKVQHIELTGKDIIRLDKNGWLKLMNGRTILINGGGNLGTLWFDVEQLSRNIINANPKSNIVFLPNTIYYEDNEWGNREKEFSRTIYNHHKRLYFYAREQESYNQMRELYRNVKLIPDMVFTLNKSGENIERKGCVLCLRNDCEKTITNEEREEIVEQAEILFGEDISFRDMCVDYSIRPNERKKELELQFEIFKKSKLIITDRLHGMIFSAITGTPCIVVNSKSHKLKGCYEWINDFEYIRFVHNISEILSTYNKIPQKEFLYDEKRFQQHFEELKTDILKLV